MFPRAVILINAFLFKFGTGLKGKNVIPPKTVVFACLFLFVFCCYFFFFGGGGGGGGVQ